MLRLARTILAVLCSWQTMGRCTRERTLQQLNGTSGSFAGSNVQLVAPDSIQKEIFAKKEAKKSWKCNLCSKCQEIPGICCRGCTCINPIELASALNFFLYSGANTAWLVCYVLDLQPFFSKDPFSNHSNEKGLFSNPFFQGFSPSF